MSIAPTDGAPRELPRFLPSTLDALETHIAILDRSGEVIAVNEAWRRFAEANGYRDSGLGVGSNYLVVCDTATGECADEASDAAAGIREVLEGRRDQFYLEYPCHSPTERRWFAMRVTRFDVPGPVRVVIRTRT